MTRSVLFLGVMTTFLATPALGGDLATGEAAFATCAACHGPQGQGDKATGAPAIGGQEAWYIVRQLQNFKNGVRGGDAVKDSFGAQMAGISQTLDAATITAVAEYTSNLPTSKEPASLGGNATNGATHFATCSACHGADGKGIQAMNAPALVFQQDWYVQRQLENFKSGVRGAHPQDQFGVQMKPMADLLDNQAMLDVTAYLMSIRDQ